MSPQLLTVCSVLVLGLSGDVLFAEGGALTEDTFYGGKKETPVGKRCRYVRHLSVEMTRDAESNLVLDYRVTDDQGTPREEETKQVRLKAEEIGPFSRILYRSWRAFSTSPKAREPGTIALLDPFRGERANYICDMYGASWVNLGKDNSPPEKRKPLSLPMEGVCATLVLLAKTEEGKPVVGDVASFRAELKAAAGDLPSPSEQEEVACSVSIVKKYGAGNWGTWEGLAQFKGIDFQLLSPREREYLKRIYPHYDEPGLGGGVSTVVRLKLDDPVTLSDLRVAFRGGYYTAYQAAEMCSQAANVKLIPLAAEFLFVEKAPKEVKMSDVIVSERPCDSAAYAIRSMLRVCPQLPEAVRQMAKRWERSNTSWMDFLVPCRDWWQENRERMEQGRYDEVTPPKAPPESR